MASFARWEGKRDEVLVIGTVGVVGVLDTIDSVAGVVGVTVAVTVTGEETVTGSSIVTCFLSLLLGDPFLVPVRVLWIKKGCC